MKYYLFVFPNTHSAIAGQKYLEGKVPFAVMPTLREISDSCGISLRIKEENFENAKEILNNTAEMEMFTAYYVESEKGKTTAKEIYKKEL